MISLHYRFGRLLPALFILALLVVAGCGGKADGSSTGTTITFWHFWSEPAQKAALMERIKAFEARNPTIHVELSELSWNDGKTKLFAAFNSNTAPDVIELGSDWIAQFSASDRLADQSAMAGDKISRFSPEVSAPGMWQGKVYAWPWVIDTRVLFYNKDLLAKAGLDTAAPDTLWSDVLAKATRIKSGVPGTLGFGANGPDQHRLYKKILPFFWSNGGALLDASGAPVVNSPQNVQALQMYLDLARAGGFDMQKQLDQSFMEGKVGYWISGSWLVDRIAKDNPKLNYGIAVMPKFAGGAPVSFAGGEYLAIDGASENKDAAKKLVAFLSSPEEALAFCKALPGGMTPADLSTENDQFLQGPVRRVFTAQLKTARMTPVHPRWLDIEETIEDEVSQALLGKKSAQQALDAAQSRITQIIKEASA
jgi:ABC-type glycerol-3-phosphate transport system substrate-binding protein